MMIRSFELFSLFTYFVAFLFSALLAAVLMAGYIQPVEIILFSVLLGAAIGLVMRQEAARRILVATCTAGIIYFSLKQILFYHSFEVAAMSLIGIFGVMIYFYRSAGAEFVKVGDSAAGKKWTVLVVDDDLTFVKLVKSHFVKKGLTVISSDSGERGLEMAKRWKPDLIVLDVILPGMKGREVCARLKEDSNTQRIPVMFVTFKNSLDDISAEMELGAVMHLTKPVNYDHLYEQAYKILVKG